MKEITGRQIVAISRIFTEGDASSEKAQALIDSGFLADLRDADISKVSRDDFRAFFGLIIRREIFSLRVREDREIKELIQLGKYEEVDEKLSTYDCCDYHSSKIGETEVAYLYFSQSLSTPEAENRLKKSFYRPATFRELLSLGVQTCLRALDFPVAATGSGFNSKVSRMTYLPYLGNERTKRQLLFHPRNKHWPKNTRFLGIRIPSH